MSLYDRSKIWGGANAALAASNRAREERIVRQTVKQLAHPGAA
jgi:hypothetical protein